MVLPGECSRGPLHLHDQIPRSCKVHHHSSWDGGHFSFGKSSPIVCIPGSCMFTPYILPPTWLPVIGNIDSHSCPSKCGLGQHKSKPATNAVYFWFCGCDAMFDALPSTGLKLCLSQFKLSDFFGQVNGNMLAKYVDMRPKGKWLALNVQRFLLGRELMVLMGFPLHRMVLGGTSESVTWLVVSFFCCNFNPRYSSTTAAFCRNPRYCMTWQATQWRFESSPPF